MVPLTQQAHEVLRQYVTTGDVVVDATAGNGHDTAFLAELVRPAGQVYAFDIQANAISATRQRLADGGHLSYVNLIQASHAELMPFIPAESHGQIKAIVFNLGYLPGSDHRIQTEPDSTVAALSKALRILDAHGVITIIAYPGHPGGKEELAAVERWLISLSPDWSATIVTNEQHDAAPHLFVIRRGH
ncbi:MAG: class I SAM-dependent methyltransferase [Planctomycetaceae bacterium]|nr:class I SAM-dependent methyltransferase [Planctomycetaceae bacterium]